MYIQYGYIYIYIHTHIFPKGALFGSEQKNEKSNILCIGKIIAFLKERLNIIDNMDNNSQGSHGSIKRHIPKEKV